MGVSLYLRYPLSYRNIGEMLLERGFGFFHSPLNLWDRQAVFPQDAVRRTLAGA